MDKRTPPLRHHLQPDIITRIRKKKKKKILPHLGICNKLPESILVRVFTNYIICIMEGKNNECRSWQ